MAGILPRRRPGFRVPRLRRSRRWTGQQQFDVISSGTLATFAIVVPADYQQSATLEASGVTLARIRGSIALTPIVAPANSDVTMVDIIVYVSEADATNVNPGTVQTLWEEEVLWYKRLIMSGGGVYWSQHALDPDIKAKRKLDNHQVRCAFVATSVNGNPFDYAICSGWRALLIGG